MDNNWGYQPPVSHTNHWISPQTRSLKRALSESDCDELYSEESSKEQTSPGDSSNSCQLLSRKKRRGVIEKKRRDRINSSLSELKRLVPSAYEKQGSAKLEKAEILQLTVEHLKNLHSKGIDTVSYDPQRFAMDYHIIGFRECAAEVARYLVTMEGMDIQDPLRLRLMSHLQYFVQQRELSAKTSTTWPSSASTAYHQSNCAPPTYQAYSTQSNSSNAYVPNLPPPVQIYPPIHSSTSSVPVHQHSSHRPAATSSSLTDSVSLPGPQPTQPAMQQQQQQQHQQSPHQLSHSHHYNEIDSESHHEQGSTYIELTSSNTHRTSTALNYPSGQEYSTSNSQVYNSNGNINYTVANNSKPYDNSKPYRPWGAEMAY